MVSKGLNTYEAWANEIGNQTSQDLSKQAVCDKLTTVGREFCEQVLKATLTKHYKKVGQCHSSLFTSFDSVLLQDSTTLKLPRTLSDTYPGSTNQSGTSSAVARVDAIFDLKTNAFAQFTLRKYTDNDQSATGHILPWVSKRSLVIRDRGYFSLGVLSKIDQAGGCFLTRTKHGVNFYCEQTGQKLDLVKMLKKTDFLDQVVLVGRQHKLCARLVILPLDKQQAEKNIRAAKQHPDKRFNHSQEYYFLKGYTIFITNVTKQIWNTHQVQKAYAMRWRIESIFKCWKTGFKLQKLIHHQCSNKTRIECYIFLMLTYMAAFHSGVYKPLSDAVSGLKQKKDVSLMKLAKLFRGNIESLFSDNYKRALLAEIVNRQCTYEVRRNRKNFIQRLNQTLT